MDIKKIEASIKERFPEDSQAVWDALVRLLLRQDAGCGLVCEACGKRGRFGSMMHLKQERYNYTLCGECGHVSRGPKKELRCDICGNYEENEGDIRIFHRGCRWGQLAKKKTKDGLAAFDPEALLKAAR